MIIAGSPPGIPGSTNALRIHRMGDAINEVAPAYRRALTGRSARPSGRFITLSGRTALSQVSSADKLRFTHSHGEPSGRAHGPPPRAVPRVGFEPTLDGV